MKLAVVGSRNFNNYPKLVECIRENYTLSNIEEIVSGGARGTDKLAEDFAAMFKIRKKIFKPDFNTHSTSAYAIRNRRIADYADECIAFVDDKSKGTRMTIGFFENKEKEVKIICV